MTTAALTLTLFGPFRAEVDGVPIAGFPTDKVRALLAYLAVEAGRPHARTSLAALLWPEMADESALSNLRKTLHRLREVLASSLGAADTLFTATRQTIQIDPVTCSVDIGAFQEALAVTAAHPHRSLHLCPPCLERLARAAALYQGEVLAGFGLPDAEPFEEWLLLKREQLLHQALQILYDLAAALLEREEYEQAYTYAARQVELDPGREEAHRQALRALALAGKRGEALAYVARCRQMLLDTLGVEPAVETMALIDQIQRNEALGAASPAAGSARLHHLPTQLTPFVGRATDLLRIMEYMRDPVCRIVSIVGQGGMGKTRLAIKAAEQQASRGRFADGIFFIPLAEIHTPDLLPTTLATALGVDLDQRGDPEARLLRYLAGRDCLLVLDNFEQLLEGRDLLLAILQAAPRVRVLVTSRVPLDIQAEQRLPLEGLEFPDQSERESPPSATTIAGAESVQMFVQAALRVQPGFHLSSANEQEILHICRLVDGMPLALELAAPWVRVMDCAAIAAALARDITLLTTRARDLPDRHRSIEAVFTQSWRLLTAEEQRILVQIAAFRGPFDLQAAEHVAGATVLDLAALLDKGLLQHTVDGFYQIHELLRQFLRGMQAGMGHAPLHAARDRQCDYFLGLVAAHEQALHGRNARAVVETLRRQIGNIRQAWEWASEHGRAEELVRCLEAMVRFWELTCLFAEAETVLAHAGARLAEQTAGEPAPDSSPQGPRARLLVWQAHFQEPRNRIDDAIRSAEAALTLARRVGDGEGEAMAHTLLGQILPRRGGFDSAITHLEEACAAFQAHNLARWLGRALRLSGVAHWRSGAYAQAIESLDRARAMQETLGDHWELARVCSALAGVAFEQGNLETARLRAHEVLRLYEESHDRRNIATSRGNLALVYQRLGRFELALQHNRYCLETSREIGDSRDVAIALGNRGTIYLESGDLEQALTCIEEARCIEEAAGNRWEAARYQGGIADVHHLRGEPAIALAYLQQALPVLRAHGAPYYLVAPLLRAAEIHCDLGQIEEAATLTHEATALVAELGLRDELVRAQALAATIAGMRAAAAEHH